MPLMSPRCFAIIDPRLLPLPHNPSCCRFYDPAVWNSDLSLAQQRATWLEMVGSRWNECPYHAGNWSRIALAACWVLEVELRNEPDVWSDSTRGDLSRYSAANLDEGEIDTVASLFDNPITWWPGQDMLDDGQHRACALRCAGATAVPVVDESRI